MTLLDSWVGSVNVPPGPVAFGGAPEVVMSPGDLDTWPKTGGYGNIMTITAGIPKEAKLIWSHEYPARKTATGTGEECTFRVTVPMPDQLFPDAWQANRIASTFQDKVKEQGGEMLDLKIYIDTTPTWTTDYYVVALIKPAAAAGAVTFPFAWAIVIPLILVLLILLAFTWVIIEIKSVDLGKLVAGVTIPFAAIAAVVGGVGLILFAASRGEAKKGGGK